MTAGPPPPGAEPVRVFNRSDRVWAFGFVRMAPLVLFLVGVLTIVAVEKQLRGLPHGVTIAFVFVCLVGPFVVDRLPQLNPVNYLWLADELQVVRLVGGRRAFAPERVVRIELAPNEGEEYDDREPRGGGIDLTIRFRGAWPARLLVSPEDARRVVDWAGRHGRPVVDRRPHDGPPAIPDN